MYIPTAHALDDPEAILDVLRRVAFGHLVTHQGVDVNTPGLSSTPLPFMVDDDLSSLRAHFARVNSHWTAIDGAEALMIVPGADAYVSPRWYPSKAEHGRVVPTWNYELVHVHGTIVIHDDTEWKRMLLDDLTAENEQRASASGSGEAWKIDDAPARFVDQQLKAIVGVELCVTRIEAQRKFSRNKQEADRRGVVEGLDRSSCPLDQQVASMMDGERVRGRAGTPTG